jgi:hypothetical protein
MPQKERPKRSFPFSFPNCRRTGSCSEQNIILESPSCRWQELQRIINLDGVNFFGKVSDFMALGADPFVNDRSDKRSCQRTRLHDHARLAAGARILFPIRPLSFCKRSACRRSISSTVKNSSRSFPANQRHFSKITTRSITTKRLMNITTWWDMNAMIQEAEFALAIGTEARQRARDAAIQEFGRVCSRGQKSLQTVGIDLAR